MLLEKKKEICCVFYIWSFSDWDGGRCMNHCVYISTSRSRPIGHLFGSLLLLWFEMLVFFLQNMGEVSNVELTSKKKK